MNSLFCKSALQFLNKTLIKILPNVRDRKVGVIRKGEAKRFAINVSDARNQRQIAIQGKRDSQPVLKTGKKKHLYTMSRHVY